MKHIRIFATGKPGETAVTDADTGEYIRNVRSVRFDHDAGKVPRITLEILCHEGAEIEIHGDAEVNRVEMAEVGTITKNEGGRSFATSGTVSSKFTHSVLIESESTSTDESPDAELA